MERRSAWAVGESSHNYRRKPPPHSCTVPIPYCRLNIQFHVKQPLVTPVTGILGEHTRSSYSRCSARGCWHLFVWGWCTWLLASFLWG